LSRGSIDYFCEWWNNGRFINYIVPKHERREGVQGGALAPPWLDKKKI